MNHETLIHDWNAQGRPPKPKSVRLNDETLRDGLQSPSVKDPSIAEKIALLHLMERLDIQAADIGLPGAGRRAVEDASALAKEIAAHHLRLLPNCAARTHVADVTAVAEVSQRAGIPVEVCCFLGSSPIRRYTEGWSVDQLRQRIEEAMSCAVKNNLPATFVTEDTTRSDPATLSTLYRTAVEHGARAVVVADTVGHATPNGVDALIRFVRKVVDDTGETVRVDFHGHRDRGLDLANSFAAWLAGADQVHAAALGTGERVGNTPMELLIVNLSLAGWIDTDLRPLAEYCRLASRAMEVPIPNNHPVFGADAFRTATGVHAAALMKAREHGDEWLLDTVYSGVPARAFGAIQRIEVGPMSGKWNAVYWLREHEVEVSDDKVSRILTAAKESTRVLSDAEVWGSLGVPEVPTAP